jgi:bis(5'-nucleosyl)-tetraphosphatase (symmetrical)
VYALDTGCVWGGAMTLLNVDTRALIRCECDERGNAKAPTPEASPVSEPTPLQQ